MVAVPQAQTTQALRSLGDPFEQLSVGDPLALDHERILIPPERLSAYQTLWNGSKFGMALGFTNKFG